MITQDIIIAHPKTKEQVNALKAFMQALEIQYEVTDEGHYNPDFVKKVLESKRQITDGKVTGVGKERLKEFIGL